MDHELCRATTMWLGCRRVHRPHQVQCRREVGHPGEHQATFHNVIHRWPRRDSDPLPPAAGYLRALDEMIPVTKVRMVVCECYDCLPDCACDCHLNPFSDSPFSVFEYIELRPQ